MVIFCTQTSAIFIRIRLTEYRRIRSRPVDVRPKPLSQGSGSAGPWLCGRSRLVKVPALRASCPSTLRAPGCRLSFKRHGRKHRSPAYIKAPDLSVRLFHARAPVQVLPPVGPEELAHGHRMWGRRPFLRGGRIIGRGRFLGDGRGQSRSL